MKAKLFKTLTFAVGIASSALFVACEKDENMRPGRNDMMATVTLENVSKPKTFNQSGLFKGSKDIIMPNEKVSIKFSAGKGQRLMFVTMYGKSNDWFFASQQPGIQLYNDKGEAITGDVSSQVKLYDNGTRGKTKEEKENKPIMEVSNVKPSELMKLDLQYDKMKSEFTLTIMNVSSGAHETPFSPGVWAVANFDGKKLLAEMPFFTPGKASNPEITNISQMGDPAKLMEKVKGETGLFTGLSPLMVVVYKADKNPIFQAGQKDMGMGLKDIAQMGKAQMLMDALKKKPEVKGVYLIGKEPLAPGKKEMMNIALPQGYKMAYVTMYGFSNDWFYANEKELPATFRGDATAATALFDSGTGIDQRPGAGNKQALFGGTSDKEEKAIQKVGDAYSVPAVKDVLRITVK